MLGTSTPVTLEHLGGCLLAACLPESRMNGGRLGRRGTHDRPGEVGLPILKE